MQPVQLPPRLGATEKEIHAHLQRKGERMKRECAASVKASWEKIKVAENPNEITPAEAIKGKIRCAFTNIRGKEIMGRK